MNPIMNIAVTGMRAAQTRIAVHTENIVNITTPDYARLRANQVSTSAGPLVRVQRDEKPRPGGQQYPGAGLAEELVGLIRGKQEFKASATVIRTANEMQGALLDILA